MSYMFYNCVSLKALSDISEYINNSVININNMFFNCKSLQYLPDISQWNTEKINDISRLFYNCESLISLPDISLWNINNVTDIITYSIIVNHYHLYQIYQNGILLMLLI